MDFSIARAPLLTLLGDTMGLPDDRRTAFLGRFQHLQRLGLISGIKPGRGRAAEYQAHHVMVFAIAFHMLQLGLNPERTVYTMHRNRQIVFDSLCIVSGDGIEIGKCVITFDPAVVSIDQKIGPGDEIAEDRLNATFTCDYLEDYLEWLSSSWNLPGTIQRTSIINVSATARHIFGSLDGQDAYMTPPMGEKSHFFLQSLKRWVDSHREDDIF